MRFVMPPPFPAVRWALTPPFHPYPQFDRSRHDYKKNILLRTVKLPGGLFSVTLSVPAVIGRPRELPGIML
jgi:hypothetical protein